MSRPLLVSTNIRIIARARISTSVRSTIDHIRPKLYTSTTLRSNKLDHRIRNDSSLSFYHYSTTTSKPKEEDDHSALNPLPLPHFINPSKGLFLIHLPIPPKHWPSHLDLYFPLLRRTTKLMKERGVVVNCIYDGIGTDTEFKEGGYVARLFTRNGSLQCDGFDQRLLGSEGFRGEIDQLLAKTPAAIEEDPVVSADMKSGTEILVCTHGSRDCRCSNLGGQLVESLRAEIEKRDLGMVVREIAHVGGHKYAANAIILPQMDMYSNLLTTDATAMLDHLSSSTSVDLTSDTPKSFNAHWRGRYGCTESEQEALWTTKNGSLSNPDITPAKEEAKEAKKVVELKFKTYEDELRVVEANIGDTLLQVARANDLPSMEGSCGGNLECSTCHLYIPPNCPIPEPTDPELDMLGYALGYKDEESRLGCQITVSDEMADWCQDGGVFGLPRY